MSTITDKIYKRIRVKKRGWVFTPKDFLDIGSRAAVDQTLSRLTKQGMIRRLDRGIYDYPKQHNVLGALSPDTDSLAHAITAKTGDIAFPSGALAANLLGLSTQVPAKSVYMTNGHSRTKKVGSRTITFKHARVPVMDKLPDNVNYVLQALSYLGKDNIDDDTIASCAKKLNDRDLKTLKSVVPQIPGWMVDLVQKMQHTL